MNMYHQDEGLMSKDFVVELGYQGLQALFQIPVYVIQIGEWDYHNEF